MLGPPDRLLRREKVGLQLGALAVAVLEVGTEGEIAHHHLAHLGTGGLRASLVGGVQGEANALRVGVTIEAQDSTRPGHLARPIRSGRSFRRPPVTQP